MSHASLVRQGFAALATVFHKIQGSKAGDGSGQDFLDFFLEMGARHHEEPPAPQAFDPNVGAGPQDLPTILPTGMPLLQPYDVTDLQPLHRPTPSGSSKLSPPAAEPIEKGQ